MCVYQYIFNLIDNVTYVVYAWYSRIDVLNVTLLYALFFPCTSELSPVYINGIFKSRLKLTDTVDPRILVLNMKPLSTSKYLKFIICTNSPYLSIAESPRNIEYDSDCGKNALSIS